MHVTYKYRAYPTSEQQDKLNQIRDATACAWNIALGHLMVRSGGKRIKTQKLDFTAMSPAAYACVSIKSGAISKYPRLVQADAETRRDAVYACIQAWDSWCTTKDRGRPQFRKSGQLGPILIKQLRGRFGNGVLKVYGTELKFNQHRTMPSIPKSAHISQDNQGRWWVGFVCERETTKLDNGRIIGIDVGVRDLIWTSNGSHVKNPAVNNTARRVKRSLQSVVSKLKVNGSKYRKLTARMNRIERDIVQRQNEVEWKIANYLAPFTVKREDLRLKNMSASGKGKRGLNGKLRGARLYTLGQKIDQKQLEHGRETIMVNARNTSRTCSNCNHVDKNSRKGVEFNCVSCRYETHADLNAAINISRGVEKKKKKRHATGARVASVGEKRKKKAADKLAEAQTGLVIKPNQASAIISASEMPEVTCVQACAQAHQSFSCPQGPEVSGRIQAPVCEGGGGGILTVTARATQVSETPGVLEISIKASEGKPVETIDRSQTGSQVNVTID